MEKVLSWIEAISIAFLIILFIGIIFLIIDFKNDYDCSTSADDQWYWEHNCMRYER